MIQRYLAEQEKPRTTGKLLPEDLTNAQRDSLAWIAALAFVQQPGLSPHALELKGVVLQQNAKHGISYQFPTNDGKTREVAHVP